MGRYMGVVRLVSVWGLAGLVAAGAVALRAQAPQTVGGPELAGHLRSAFANVRQEALAELSTTERAQLSAVYARRGWAPLWVDGSFRPHADAREALQIIAGAAGEGLDPRDYRAAQLTDQGAALGRVPTPEDADVAAFDVGLSASIVLYFHALHAGRVDPRAIGFRMTTAEDDHDFSSLLVSALDAHRIAETAAELAPQLALYRQLRTELARYRSLADPSLALPVSAITAVRPGEPYGDLSALRRVLVALGDWPGDLSTPGESTVYDGAFVEGVKRFQIRHGLDADGVLGAQTLEALRVPLTWRVRQIELGLERLRWLPHLGKGRLLAVNIPMFRLWAWDSMVPGDVPAFGSRVIVGRALDTETPVFVEQMNHIIFRPYWNVPHSIVRDEILPGLARAPNYLERQHMEIVDGPGDDARPVGATPEALAQLRQGRLRLRQRPGASNALGLVKFVFPNDENVYLHGTPSTELFARSRRDFSHGCVRVEDPVALAEWALAGQNGWTRDRIQSAMNGTEPIRVNLARPIPVILFYITAAVTPEDGKVHFARDIYGHDPKLDRALALRGGNR